MCNLYNITTSQDAVREQRTRAMLDLIGNLEPPAGCLCGG